jgi:hypothetical protein
MSVSMESVEVETFSLMVVMEVLDKSRYFKLKMSCAWRH